MFTVSTDANLSSSYQQFIFDLLNNFPANISTFTVVHVHGLLQNGIYLRRDFFANFCECSKSQNNTIAKNFNGYIVFIVVTNFRKDFSIAKNFPSRFPDIFANIFKRKIIPVYSSFTSRLLKSTCMTFCHLDQDVLVSVASYAKRSLYLIFCSISII